MNAWNICDSPLFHMKTGIYSKYGRGSLGVRVENVPFFLIQVCLVNLKVCSKLLLFDFLALPDLFKIF